MSDELLDLAIRAPVEARRRAEKVLAVGGSPGQKASALRALAVLEREDGRHSEAVRYLRRAMRVAENAEDLELETDIRATYGVTLVVTGQVQIGLRELARASRDAVGVQSALVAYRLGVVESMLGRKADAVVDLRRAVVAFRVAGDDAWLATALASLGSASIECGHLSEAEKCLNESGSLYAGEEESHDFWWLRASVARLEFARGNLPAALETYSELQLRRLPDARMRGTVAYVHILALLAAGLNQDAIDLGRSVDLSTIPAPDAGAVLGLLAEAQFASGAYEIALATSADADERLEATHATWYSLHAKATALKATIAIGKERRLTGRAVALAEDLEAVGSERAVELWILAGRLATEPSSGAIFRRASAYRSHTNRLVVASGWLGCANERSVLQQPGVLSACGRGLNALDEYRQIMGSSELRASMTHRGRELAELALRHAARDPRTLLTWSERWRATSLAQPPVTPHGDVSPAVAMLRDSGRRIAEARAAGESTEALEKERRSLERKVRAEHHQQHADGKSEAKRFNPADLVTHVGDGAFVELVEVDGVLHVLVVSRGRVRRVIAGETKAALELAEAGRFALRRAARTGRFAPGDLGERFQKAVLGKAVHMLPDGPVTISPTATLHGAPFALMPALKARPFSIVPSAAQWMRALAVPMPRTQRRAFVSGPGLLTGGAEVRRLAVEYPDATVLRGADASINNTMKAIDGAKLAHLATHGTFRADSPLFSALELADGPLSVYELERLKRAPYRTILSACDSGVLAPVGAQEVLGLASALFSLGSAGLVCSIAEVNDEATADLMMRVHASLDAKRTPAEALAQVRESGSPIEQATAAAFVALGV